MSDLSVRSPAPFIPPSAKRWNRGYIIDLSIAAASIGLCALFALSPAVLIAVLVAILVLLIIRWTDLLLYSLFAILPIALWLPYDVPVRDLVTLSHYGAAIGIAIVRAAKRRSIRSWLFGTSYNWFVYLYAAIAVASLIYSHNFTESAERSLLRLGSYIAFYFAITGWLETEEQLRVSTLVLLVSTIIVSIFGIVQKLFESYTPVYWWFYTVEGPIHIWDGRITSLLNYSNSLAGYLNLLIPLGLGCMFMSRSAGVRKLGKINTILGSIAMLLTQSRGGLLALAVTFLICIWYAVEERARRILFSVVYLVSLMLIVLAFRAYSDHLGAVDSQDVTGRMVLWISAWLMFMSSPVIGIGYGNFRESFDTDFVGTTRGSLDAHNLYLQLLSETGITGLVGFGLVSGMLILKAIKALRTASTEWTRIVCFAGLCAVVSILMHGTVDFLFEVSAQFGSAAWAMIALTICAASISKNREADSMSGRAAA